MSYRGRVRNGVIVLEPPASLPEGAEVEVREVGEEPSIPTLYERYKDFIGIADGLPSDSSINHDHYLYGAPKK
jgi:hypothetical protein